MSFLTELKRRNVIRMAGLYAVGSWLIVQVAGTVFPAPLRRRDTMKRARGVSVGLSHSRMSSKEQFGLLGI